MPSPSVVGTQISINCLCVGDTSRDDVFSLSIGMRNSVAELREMVIGAMGFAQTNIDRTSMTLWRVHKDAHSKVWDKQSYSSTESYLCAVAVLIGYNSGNVANHFGPTKHPDKVHLLVDWPARPVRERLRQRATLPLFPAGVDMHEVCRDPATSEEPEPPSVLSSSTARMPTESVRYPSVSAPKSDTISSTATAMPMPTAAYPEASYSQASNPISFTAHPINGAIGSLYHHPAALSLSISVGLIPPIAASSEVPSLQTSQCASSTLHPSGLRSNSGSAATVPASIPPASAAAAAFPTATAPLKATPQIPLALLHPAFGRFIDDLEDPYPSEHAYQFVSKLSNAELSASCRSREVCLANLLHDHYGIHLRGKSPRPFGMIRLDILDGYTYIMMHCIEDTTSTPDRDVFNLCYQAYDEYVSLKFTTRPATATIPVLPCLHIIISGQFISFAGSAMVSGAQRFEILLPAILFQYNPLYSSDAMRTQAACAFKALVNAAESLKTFYSDSPSRSLNTPYPRFYRCLRTNFLVTLLLDSLIQEDSEDLVYRDCAGAYRPPLLVRFTRRYPGEVQSHPSTRAVEKLPGGWAMIVSDIVG